MVRDHLKKLIGNALASATSRDDLLKALLGFDTGGEGQAPREPPPAEANETAAAEVDGGRADSHDVSTVVERFTITRIPEADLPDPASAAAGSPEPSSAEAAAGSQTAESGTRWPAASSLSLQKIMDSVKDAILKVDRDGTVLSANLSAARLFREAAEALPGRSMHTLIPTLAEIDKSLDTFAGRIDDSGIDLTPQVVEAQRPNGASFDAELTISRIEEFGQECFILCIRDVTDRLEHIQALRESEGRYRALVENAPEAILVLDVEEGRFVDANANAVNLFKLTRAEILEVGPEAISPEFQSDGLPSFGLQRGFLERALKGGRPVFEWLHCDATGKEFPCEVRFIRLPASSRKLIRASIIDVTARRRADGLAYGERKVLELIAANAPLDRTLQAVVNIAEQMQSDIRAVVMLLDEESHAIRLAAANAMPDPLRSALIELPVGLRSGSCGAAASLGRQVVITDITEDPMCADLRESAEQSGVRGCCSTPIMTTGDRIHGTLAIYFTQPRNPKTEELDLASRLAQVSGIAIKRKQDEAALRESEARFRALFDNVVDGVFQVAPDGRLLTANPAFVNMLGYDELEEMSGLRMSDFCVNAVDRRKLMNELETHGRVRNYEYRMRRNNGNIIVVVENSRAVYEGERITFVEGTITDVTQRKAAERALYKEKELAQVTLQSIGDAVLTTDADGRVEYLNPVAEELTRWERRAAQGKRVDEVIALTNEATGEAADDPVMRCLREGRVIALSDSTVLVDRNGVSIAVQISAAPIQDRHGNTIGAVMVFHDVSSERQLHRKLSYYASHDSLTGLINRREFEDRLSTLLDNVKAGTDLPAVLLYVDLDQFKVVNDTCGHAAGDLLLRQLAEVVQARVRVHDVLARLGGDEFAVLLENCAVERASEVADQLREAISEFRFNWRDGAMQVGASIGIVPVDKESRSVASLLSAADVACYVAKDLGRNRIHVYESSDAAERHQEMKWVARINSAREQERLELYYQPIVPIGTKGADYPQFELLLRMRDEDGKLVMPNEFIPAAERYNLMPSIDRWVIHEVLEGLIYRGDGGHDAYMLTVNLSGTSLNDAKFLDFLLAELGAAQIAEGTLCFEITETAAIANLGSVVRFMRTLKERGCRFSLDDFGTGLSSLTYLKNLPVDYVKIDGQFIRNVIRDKADESVIDAIARMAKAFNIKTIAERVESRAVLKRLGEIGIAFAQGYFIAVPQPIAELPVRARAKRAKTA